MVEVSVYGLSATKKMDFDLASLALQVQDGEQARQVQFTIDEVALADTPCSHWEEIAFTADKSPERDAVRMNTHLRSDETIDEATLLKRIDNAYLGDPKVSVVRGETGKPTTYVIEQDGRYVTVQSGAEGLTVQADYAPREFWRKNPDTLQYWRVVNSIIKPQTKTTDVAANAAAANEPEADVLAPSEAVQDVPVLSARPRETGGFEITAESGFDEAWWNNDLDVTLHSEQTASDASDVQIRVRGSVPTNRDGMPDPWSRHLEAAITIEGDSAGRRLREQLSDVAAQIQAEDNQTQIVRVTPNPTTTDTYTGLLVRTHFFGEPAKLGGYSIDFADDQIVISGTQEKGHTPDFVPEFFRMVSEVSVVCGKQTQPLIVEKAVPEKEL